MNAMTRRVLGVGCAMVLAGLAYESGRAKAGNASNVPMTFTGVLQSNGQPALGTHQVAFDLWSTASTMDPSDHLCSMPAAPVSVASDGTFQVVLSKACQAVFPLTSTVWYQFTVDGTAFPLTPVSPVPYSMWSGAANNVLKPLTWNLNGVQSTVFVSTLGAVCGSTPPTTGSFADPLYQTVGLQAAKTLCQTACASPTAHICLLEDLNRVQTILGTSALSGTTGWVEQTGALQGGGFDCAPPTWGCASVPVGGSYPTTFTTIGSGNECQLVGTPPNTYYTITSNAIFGYDYGASYTNALGAPQAGACCYDASLCANIHAPGIRSDSCGDPGPYVSPGRFNGLDPFAHNYGTVWGPGGVSYSTTCDTPTPILCCD